MKAETTFNHGLKIRYLDGRVMGLGSCTYHDDHKFMVDGNRLMRFWDARDTEPDQEEILPSGTVVMRWDEDEGDPVLFTV